MAFAWVGSDLCAKQLSFSKPNPIVDISSAGVDPKACLDQTPSEINKYHCIKVFLAM